MGWESDKKGHIRCGKIYLASSRKHRKNKREAYKNENVEGSSALKKVLEKVQFWTV